MNDEKEQIIDPSSTSMEDELRGDYPSVMDQLTYSAQDNPPTERDEWVTTYMDLITLLLTLFIVLLAYADKVGETDFQDVSQSIAEASRGVVQLGPQSEPSFNDEIDEMDSRLRTTFQQSGLSDETQIKQTSGTLQIQLNEKILFDSGEAKLNSDALPVLDLLSNALMDTGYRINIQGHTDNIPINTPNFPSNWELSASRASSVVRYLVEAGLPADQLSATGLADSQPLESNDTEQGRAANRRVTVVISK